MANSIEPDQTDPDKQFDLGLHCLHLSFAILSETLLCESLGLLSSVIRKKPFGTDKSWS